MAPSDNDLIARFQGGDAAAFSELVQRWDRRVYGLAYRVTGDAAEAGDVRQMAFMRAYAALASFNGHATFATWMYRVVVNLCRDRMRSQEVRRRHVRSMPAAAGGTADEPPSTRSACERHEVADRVASAVADLPSAEREVVVLRHYQDLTFVQIAEVLDMPASTVKSRMNQALGLLRTRLKDVDG
jgi:RNA polymerase sigma-70 factor (ECF subfamily)